MRSQLPGTCRLHQLQSWPSSSTACSAPMCKRRSSDLPFSDSQDAATATTVDDNMDVHILMDMLTLCVVALLVIIFIVVQVTKRRRQLLATRSTRTQTTSIVPDLDATIFKINSKLSSLHDRLESMEQERLEEINSHRFSTSLASPTQEDPVQSKATWPGANPIYPSY